MDRLRVRARELRKNPTDAERLLWQKLRYWQVDGCKFRRQQPLGDYIVDFVCLQKRLIVELDGGQHMNEADYDKERDGWLRDQGFVVLRFWNNDVLTDIDGVMDVIVKNLKSTPYLNPSPQGGKESAFRCCPIQASRKLLRAACDGCKPMRKESYGCGCAVGRSTAPNFAGSIQ